MKILWHAYVYEKFNYHPYVHGNVTVGPADESSHYKYNGRKTITVYVYIH